ncbi:MAG: family 43 glycosylhydrolase [Bacteroidaceae bacterium]|nr:family 43 glycosylhydrolase [Bacteroidaceae bacterium]
MKTIICSILAGMSLSASAQGLHLAGEPFIHDPSTIAVCDGKYYTFGTGEGGLWSADGWTWNRGAVRPGRGAAPDVLKIGDRYLVAYSTTGGGLGGTHKGTVVTMWNKTLDPKSPDFKYTEPVVVAESADDEDCDAIDAGLLLDPTTGRLWCSYGTYFGFIRIVELDPKTGKRKEGNVAQNIAIDCEATDLLYRNGWYYLLGTHGTCCDGVNSTYNIVVGRSKSVTGPYLDNMGRDMLHGGGKMVTFAEGRCVGAGHFGRFIEADGVEKTSFHWEADMDRGGYSTLAIRPLLWKNDGPVAGDLFKAGKYAVISERRGYALELAVDFIRLEQERGRWWQIDSVKAHSKLKGQTLADVQSTWAKATDAEGRIPARLCDYMARPHQLWKIEPATDKEGYLGSLYYKIMIDGTDRALTANGTEVTTAPYKGQCMQLWRIEQCTDGTYRIMPKCTTDDGKLNTTICLYSAGDSTPSLAPWDMNSDNAKWGLKSAE